MISQDVDGFLIYPLDPVASAPNYDLIGCKGIPYVLIDRYNPNSTTFGFDDWDILRRNKVGIATVKQNFEEIGSHAANLLVNAAQGKFTDNSTTILTGVELVIRESICENKWY